jgi:signal transduction histidine kinase
MPESAALPGHYDVYISLVWLLVIVITVLALFLCYLHLSVRRALEREQTSLEFSLLAIEALETERRRVSRELHDTVLPLVRGDAAVSDLVRSICMELMPPDFDRLSLKDCLADLCMKFTRRTGIECACFVEETVDFSPFSAESRLHLYRIVQESFTNIEKHSRAGKASLVVRRLPQAQSPDRILICVSDDGRGLSGAAGEGLGIRGIRQRAVVVGARLDFVSESGNGLMVRLELAPPDVSAGAANAGQKTAG